MSSGMADLNSFLGKVDRVQGAKPPRERVSRGRRPDDTFPEDPVVPGKLISATGPSLGDKMKNLIAQLEDLQDAASVDDVLAAASRVPKARGRGIMPKLANQARGALARNPAVRETDPGLGEDDWDDAWDEDEELDEDLEPIRLAIADIIAQGMGLAESEEDDESPYDFTDIADEILSYIQEGAKKRRKKHHDKHDWDNEMDGQGAPGDDET